MPSFSPISLLCLHLSADTDALLGLPASNDCVSFLLNSSRLSHPFPSSELLPPANRDLQFKSGILPCLPGTSSSSAEPVEFLALFLGTFFSRPFSNQCYLSAKRDHNSAQCHGNSRQSIASDSDEVLPAHVPERTLTDRLRHDFSRTHTTHL